jgi:hypothetical protein
MKTAALSLLLFLPLLSGQTRVTPDCVIPFSFTKGGQHTPLGICGAPNGGPNGSGISNWILVYYSTGFALISLGVQSASDSGGAPGPWVDFPGTVLSSAQYPGSSGVNPNTANTSAMTGLAGYFPWMRVYLLGTRGGPGKVKGVLYGYYDSTLARNSFPCIIQEYEKASVASLAAMRGAFCPDPRHSRLRYPL